MIHVQNGTARGGKTITSAHLVLSSPNHPMVLNRGMNSSVSGTKYVRKIPVASTLLPQNFIRAKEYAARMLITIEIATEHTVTMTEFTKKVGKSVLVKRS